MFKKSIFFGKKSEIVNKPQSQSSALSPNTRLAATSAASRPGPAIACMAKGNAVRHPSAGKGERGQVQRRHGVFRIRFQRVSATGRRQAFRAGAPPTQASAGNDRLASRAFFLYVGRAAPTGRQRKMGVKGILGIRNRTENWKTARFFAPLFSNGGVHLAQKILKQPENEIPHVRLELYWKGMRDHIYETKEDRNPKKLAHCYDSQFQGLRDRIEDYGKFRKLKSRNYISKGNEESLCNNLINTEIDIVIETPDHLLIGEAKHESNFGANSELVLVHQLVRQYVMAKILVGLRKCEKEVIPFVVGGSKNNHQIQFMICQGWIVEDNILCWEEIKALWP